jgi:hypothetical protein
MSEQYIFNLLMLEAESSVKRLVKRGISRQDATAKVIAEMALNENEAEHLQDVVNSTPVSEMPSPDDLSPNENVICFKTSADVDTAASILMLNKVPWRIKSTQPCFISFDNPACVSNARNVLSRKWDFVESENRNVATISFDNLDEYNKVLAFIRKNGFAVDTSGVEMLGEDLSDELAEKIKKRPKDNKIEEFDISAKNHKFDALSKNDSVLESPDFSHTNKQHRSIKIRKKWK